MREALLIIDVQNDYFPGGANELVRPCEAEKKIRELIADSRVKGRPVIYIQHFNPPDDVFFLEGTKGAEIIRAALWKKTESDRRQPCRPSRTGRTACPDTRRRSRPEYIRV